MRRRAARKPAAVLPDISELLRSSQELITATRAILPGLSKLARISTIALSETFLDRIVFLNSAVSNAEAALKAILPN